MSAGSPWYRNPHTTAERKAYYAARDIVDVNGLFVQIHVRPARSANALPNAWDDKPCCVQHSWKVQRKTQYKTVDV